MLAKLGLLTDIPVCTDLTTKPWVIAAGVEVLNQPFCAKDNIATAGGCLASHYLVAWIIARLEGRKPPKAHCTMSPRSARRRNTSSAPGATSPPPARTRTGARLKRPVVANSDRKSCPRAARLVVRSPNTYRALLASIPGECFFHATTWSQTSPIVAGQEHSSRF